MGQKVIGGIKIVDMRDFMYWFLKQEFQGLDYCKFIWLDLLLDMFFVFYDIQLLYLWNNNDWLFNVFVKEDDKFIFYWYLVVQSIDVIRGKVGYICGLYVWQIIWVMRQWGIYVVVGVVIVDVFLYLVGYIIFVGNNYEFWGWDLGCNWFYYDGKNQLSKIYLVFLELDEIFIVFDFFLVVLDMDDGMLSFIVDGQYMGVVFWGFKGKKLYFVVSVVWGYCEI